MKAYVQARLVLVTCANLREARSIANSTVRKRLAACVNIVQGPVESIYQWKGKVESARELLLVVKTTAKLLPQLEREVRRLHSYEVPEFLVLPVVAGSQKYLAWISDSVR